MMSLYKRKSFVSPIRNNITNSMLWNSIPDWVSPHCANFNFCKNLADRFEFCVRENWEAMTHSSC